MTFLSDKSLESLVKVWDESAARSAARIEKLEAALREIADQEPVMQEMTALHQVCQCARAALETQTGDKP